MLIICQFELHVQDAFIVDTGSGGIFAWVGKRATRDEKKAAFNNAVVSLYCLPASNILYKFCAGFHY